MLAPLIIHFWGRTEPKLLDFPSLMLVHGKLAQAMRRHRMKNWLQLILRIAAILFLVLAAGDPIRRSLSGFTPPNSAALLLHNGAFSALSRDGHSLESEQLQTQRSLDSLTGGKCLAELLIENPLTRGPVARFGNYSEAMARLIRKGSGIPSFHLFVPVFDWRDLANLGPLVKEDLAHNPDHRLVLFEYPELQQSLTPFENIRLTFPKDGLTAALKARLYAPTPSVLWTPYLGSPRELPLSGKEVEVLVPLSNTQLWSGTLSIPATMGLSSAFPNEPIHVRIPPAANLCHLSSPDNRMSMTSLGQEGWRRHVHSFATTQELVAEGDCQLLFLADQIGSEASALSKAVSLLRQGGKVILSLGQNSDIARLNRNLLVPLQIGSLTTYSHHDPALVKPQGETFSTLGMDVSTWGEVGKVSSHLEFIPHQGTSVLLAANQSPILFYRKIAQGELLVWTTDLNNPESSDLGFGLWPALVNQHFSGGIRTQGIGLQQIASDSTWLLLAPESESIKVLDPEGHPFPRVRPVPTGWQIGPFDQLGLYQVQMEKDSLRQAIHLDPHRVVRNLSPSLREDFLASLGPQRAQVHLLQSDPRWTALYHGFHFRWILLLIAALLLLVEGMVSVGLRPTSTATKV